MRIEWYQHDHLEDVLRVFESIRDAIPNEAFFNWPAESFRDELKNSKTLVIKDRSQIFGFLIFREDAEKIEIMVLGTHAKMQKRGLMPQLLFHLQSYAAQQGKPIWLEVHAENDPARAVYRKTAFELSHLRKNYYKEGASAEVYVWQKQKGFE